MHTIPIAASKEYRVLIGSGLLAKAPELLSECLPGRGVMLVSDDSVYPLYGEALQRQLQANGFQCSSFVVPHGERSKTISVYARLLQQMNGAGLTRADAVLALGGGVVGDLAGFAAATYQRGIHFVQLPTTLLAAVDSSVGGKTALDLPGGKNQVGAFYQPDMVLCDTDTLQTLPASEYANGCAEVIKYGMLGSKSLCNRLLVCPIKAQYEAIIAECVEIKRAYVESDERDKGARMFLNLGHTLGHAAEVCSDYGISHGEGVAMGMAAVTRSAVGQGLCSQTVYNDLTALLNAYNLPTRIPYSTEQLYGTVLSDKKRNGDRITVVLPVETGRCVLQTLTLNTFFAWISAEGVL